MPKITLEGTQLFFDIYGSCLSVKETEVIEKPALLVLHGAHGMVDHTLYVDFWSQFSDIAQVILLDQRGCGRSGWNNPSKWNLHQWGQDVFDFCQALGIDKPIVAGVSMGGHVMCEYATKYPAHPGGLIFCNTEAKLNLDLMAAKFAALGGEEVGEIARKNFTNPTPEIVKAYQEKCVPFYAKNAYTPMELKRCKQHLEVFEHYCQHEFKSFDYLDKLYKISCPTLLMVGEESPGHPPKSAEEMAANINKELITYHEFKGAGAPVYKDALIESEQVVRNFILNC